jgi:hypothetical protein
VESIPITNTVVGAKAAACVQLFGGRDRSVQVRRRHRRHVQRQGASNYVIKSGEQFRGSGFSISGTRRSMRKRSFRPSSDDNQHECGVTLGGPLPNQMFFFGAFDGYRDRRQTRRR